MRMDGPFIKRIESNKTLVNAHNASNIDKAYGTWKRELIKIPLKRRR